MEKFYKENCLTEQAFVKNPDQSVNEYTAEVAKGSWHHHRDRFLHPLHAGRVSELNNAFSASPSRDLG